MPALRRLPLMAAARLTAGILCDMGSGASGNGRSCVRWCGGEVVARIARRHRWPTRINSRRFAAGAVAVAARAAAGGCGSEVAAQTYIYLPGPGAGDGAGASAPVVVVPKLLPFTRNGDGGSVASRYVT